MCLLLYFGSNQPLPLIPWDYKKPDFHVSEIPPDQSSIKDCLALPYVYLTGSHEKCSCAFNYGREYPEYEDNPEDLERAKKYRGKLYAYLNNNEVLKIYPCEWDDRNKPVEKVVNITIDTLLQNDFILQSCELLIVEST